MPVYQYACTECGEELEARQSFTDDPLTVCPACSGRLRKVLTAVGVVFKGSGFYRNDSRAAASAGESGTTAATAEKAGGTGDSAASSNGSSGDSGSGSSDQKSDGTSSPKATTPGKGSPAKPGAGGSPAAAAAR